MELVKQWGRNRSKKKPSKSEKREGIERIPPRQRRFDNLTEEQIRKYLNWYSAVATKPDGVKKDETKEKLTLPKLTESKVNIRNPTNSYVKPVIEDKKIPVQVHAMRVLTTSEELQLRHDMSDLYNTGRYTIAYSMPFAPREDEMI